VTVFVNW